MQPRLLYHITDYRNLASILEKGALTAHSQVMQGEIAYEDIAHRNIQNRRSMTTVPVSPCGRLHDYVPFYFATKSPMLYSIKNGGVESYYGKQSDLIYLVTRTDIISKCNKEFVFTDGHAIMAFTEFYKDLSDLDKVDWKIMQNKYWSDTDEDPDRKRRRQAEFLIHGQVELKLFLGIGVYNQSMKDKVDTILKEMDIHMDVYIRTNFYY